MKIWKLITQAGHSADRRQCLLRQWQWCGNTLSNHHLKLIRPIHIPSYPAAQQKTPLAIALRQQFTAA